MRVYFLNPPFMPHFGRAARWQDTGRGGTLYYPIWLSYATAVVEEEYRTRLVDAPAWGWNRKDVINDVKKFKPDLIILDSSFPSLVNDTKVAEAIKQDYDAKIVLVGPPASQFAADILESDGIDIVARFEYDFTIKEIVDRIERNKGLNEVKGISYKENQKIAHNVDRESTCSEDLNRIPFVSRVYERHLNVKDYFLGSSLYPEVQIFTGRGCPFLCTFCSWPQTLMGRKYRVRSVDNVLDELEWIQENLDVKEVFFEDDTFTIDRRRVLEFAKEYVKLGLDIAWACNARVGLDYKTMREMRKANCRLVIVGYESGSDRILKNVRKGITVEQIRQFARDTKKAGLLVHGDFIIGLPGETKETIEKTERLIKEIRPDILQVSVATPFPGTEFYEGCKKKGYLITDNPDCYLDEQGHQKSVVSYPWLSAEDITRSVDQILKEYYLSVEYIPTALKQIFRKNSLQELRRLLRSAIAFTRYMFQKR